MTLKEYFESKKGTGVLATSDKEGKVDAAIFSRPHVMEDGTVAFIMNDRLSHENILQNPHAAFLFREEGGGYMGKRFFLTKVREEEDTELLHSLKRRKYPNDDAPEAKGPKFLVFFTIDKELPLIGPGK